MMLRRWFFKRKKKAKYPDCDHPTKATDISVQARSLERSLEDTRELFSFGDQNFRHELEYKTCVDLGLKEELNADAKAIVHELMLELRDISAKEIYEQTLKTLEHIPLNAHREIIEQGFKAYLNSLNAQAKSLVSQYRRPLASCGALVPEDEYEAYRAALLKRKEYCDLELNLPRFYRES